MPELKLLAETGRPSGSAAARRLRHEGRIPGVVYGHGITATPVSVDARALRAVLSTKAGQNAVIELELAGAQHLAMAKDVQRHPVRGTVAHIDFVVVNRNEVVTVDVPVNLVGEATEVNLAGGTVEHQLFALTVHTTPDRIPDALEADISGLTIGNSVRVGDLKLPNGVRTDVDPEVVVASGLAPRVEEEVAPAEAEAEEAAVEGEAGVEAAASGAAGSGAAGAGGEGSGEG
jgi:large subunit ribosomal protein L25